MSLRPLTRTLLVVTLVVVAVLFAAALILPRFLDVNRYRGLIEERAEAALGRDIRLGEMKLSLLPVLGLRIDDVAIAALPEEGGGDLITAASLRVGARLGPLLRRRLEVTSISLVEPSMVLSRDAAGRWNVERLVVPRETADDTASPQDGTQDAGPGTGERGADLAIDVLQLTGGRLVVRDASIDPPVEMTLVDIDLRLRDVRPGELVRFELVSRFDSAPDAELALAGEAGPLAGEADEPFRITANLALERMSAAALEQLAAVGGITIENALGPRPFAVAASIDATLGSSSRVEVADLTVRGADVRLRRSPEGLWNVGLRAPAPGASGRAETTGQASKDGTSRANDTTAAPGAEGGGIVWSISTIALSDIGLQFVDESAATRLATLELDDVTLDLDRLPTDGPAVLRGEGRLRQGNDSGLVRVEGSVGPMGDSPASLVLDLNVEAEALPVAALRGLLPASSSFGDEGTVSLSGHLAAAFPEQFEASGTVELVGASFMLGQEARRVAVDLGADFDLGATHGGDRLDIRTIKVDLGGERLEIQGTVEATGAGRQVDLAIPATRVSADNLMAVLGLVSIDLPFALASSQPIEIEARARGLWTEDRVPELTGRVQLRDARVEHAALAQPLEALDASLSFRGQSVEVESFRTTIGGSDLSGRFAVASLAEPHVEFELSSGQADLGEILSVFGGGEAPTSAPASAASDGSGGASSPAIEVSAAGTIRVARGTWDRIAFTDLEAAASLDDARLTLDPVRMSLYDGVFAGRLSADLGTAPPAFELDGEADGVDLEPFLSESLDVPSVLMGRFSGTVTATGAGGDYDTIVRSLQGSGTARLDDGRIGGLDILRTVSRVAGVFGQKTLAGLSSRLAEQSTVFEHAQAGYRLDGGQLVLDQLDLVTPDFGLLGQGAADLLTSGVGGQFEIAFSQDLSERMRVEGSRAAELFWNQKSLKIVMPWTLSGSLDTPAAKVDWESAVKGFVVRKAEEELLDFLESQLGRRHDRDQGERDKRGGEESGRGEEPPGEQQEETRTPKPGARPATGSGGPTAEIVEVQWLGSPPSQLEIRGEVAGADLDRAALEISDAGGRVVARRPQLDDVESHLAATRDRFARVVIPWRVSISGDGLRSAQFPVTLVLVVMDGAGRRAEARRTVER